MARQLQDNQIRERNANTVMNRRGNAATQIDGRRGMQKNNQTAHELEQRN